MQTNDVSDPLLTAEEASLHLFGEANKTARLAKWRCRGLGPKHCKLGRDVRYRRSTLDRWIADSERAGTRHRERFPSQI